MKKYIVSSLLLLFVCLGSSLSSMAQERPGYALYMLHQPLVNPAAMGTFDRFTASSLFSAQMTGFPGAPMTGLVDIVAPVGKTGLSIGGNVIFDKAGLTDRTTLGANFAYRITLNPKNYLTFGLGFSAEMMNSRLSSGKVDDPNDPLLAQDIRFNFLPNARAGVYYFRENFYIGFAAGNFMGYNMENTIGAPRVVLNTNWEDMHFYLNSGFNVNISEHWKFQPSVMVKHIAGSPVQVDVNARFLVDNKFGFGVSYRTLSTFMALASYTINDVFTIAYAASIGLDGVRNANYHGHEVMLTFKAKKSKQVIPVNVPRF